MYEACTKSTGPKYHSPMHTDLNRKHVIDCDDKLFTLISFDDRSRGVSVDEKKGSGKPIC